MNTQQIIIRSGLRLLGLLGLTLFASPVAAQVPAAAQVFDTVINVPSDPNIGNNQSIGGDGLTTQLNLFAGGSVGNSFNANFGSELNISGGSVGNDLGANSGSVLNISGGSIGGRFDANSGSVVNISGGTVAFAFTAFNGSEVNVSGGSLDAFDANFDSAVNITGGTFGDEFEAFAGSVVNISGGSFNDLVGVRPNSLVNISGGTFGDFDTSSVVNISGGTFANNFEVFSGGEANISGGTFGDSFEARQDSVVNISGGSIGDFYSANFGVTNISGGSVGNSVVVNSFGEVNISGGTVGNSFEARPSGDVELIGGEFRLNGDAFSSSTISLAAGDTFTGTLMDGSAFIFSEAAFDTLSNVELTMGVLPALNLLPVVVSTANPTRPSGLRAGQTLILQDGGELGINFEVVDATLNVEGGNLGDFAGAAYGEVNINGGTVGSNFDALAGSAVNISGGSIGDTFEAFSDSAINLYGSDFVLDGLSLDALTIGDAFTIGQRNVLLSGLYADGSPFSFDLNAVRSLQEDYFDPDATVTVTLVSSVPEPGALTLLGLGSVMLLSQRRKTCC